MIAVVLGTRPEIIKLSPVIRSFVQNGIPFYIIHTGQHYTHNLDHLFFESLGLPEPKYHLSVGSGSHGTQTAGIIQGIENVLLTDKPDVLLVQGDTNSVLAAAIVSAKLSDIQLGHVEAGLRSYDRTMPEEVNRTLTDHASDLLFAPTPNAKRILLGEGIAEENIWVTGNTIVDAVQENLPLAYASSSILSQLHVEPKSFLLLTIHRQENVVEASRLRELVKAVNAVAEEWGMRIVCPVHPRTREGLERYDIILGRLFLTIDPVGYFDFLMLECQARLIFTDSGGVQEEACILHTPCVTLRENTERPETIEVGANCLGGINYNSITSSAEAMLGKDTRWENPFGDGKAGERIASLSMAIADQNPTGKDGLKFSVVT